MTKSTLIVTIQRITFIFLILFIIVPLLIPLLFSVSSSWTGIMPKSLTLDWYKGLLSQSKYYRGLITSLIIASSAVFLDMLVCIPAAYSINRLRGRMGNVLSNFFKIFPLLFPPILIGTGFVQSFNRAPLALAGSALLVVFAHAAIGFPFMFRNVLAALQTIKERDLSEAAASLGANLRQRFFYVLIPNISSGILSGALLVFALSMGEFEVTMMIAGFGWKTMPLLLYRSLIDDIRVASAISGILIFTSVGAFLTMVLVNSHVERRTRRHDDD